MASPVKIELDTREFIQTLNDYMAVSKKTEQEIVVDRAKKLSFELYKAFKKLAPPVPLLRSLPTALDYRIKRKFKGASVKSEIARRIRARFAASAGWLPSVWRFSRGQRVLRGFKNPKGRVDINLSEPSVTLINSMKEAVAAEAKYNAMQYAINAQVSDMRKYIERKLDERARQFSAR